MSIYSPYYRSCSNSHIKSYGVDFIFKHSDKTVGKVAIPFADYHQTCLSDLTNINLTGSKDLQVRYIEFLHHFQGLTRVRSLVDCVECKDELQKRVVEASKDYFQATLSNWEAELNEVKNKSQIMDLKQRVKKLKAHLLTRNEAVISDFEQQRNELLSRILSAEKKTFPNAPDSSASRTSFVSEPTHIFEMIQKFINFYNEIELLEFSAGRDLLEYEVWYLIHRLKKYFPKETADEPNMNTAFKVNLIKLVNLLDMHYQKKWQYLLENANTNLERCTIIFNATENPDQRSLLEALDISDYDFLETILESHKAAKSRIFNMPEEECSNKNLDTYDVVYPKGEIFAAYAP